MKPSDSGITGQGTLTLHFYLKNRKGRSEALSGIEQFQRALKHFDGQFNEIRADWFPATKVDKLSDNLAEFNRITGGKAPKTKEQAALETWTGRQAAAAGFTEVEVLMAIGAPGAYKRVAVIYRRPKRAP